MNVTTADQLALSNAIENDDLPIVSRVIANGLVNLNHTDAKGRSPLMHAAALGRIAIMSLLLDAGSSIDFIDSQGKSVYHALVAHKQSAALQWLLNRGELNLNFNAESDLLLQGVSRNRDDRIAVLLLDAGAPLDSMKPVELMHLVAVPKSLSVLQRLLKRGVDVKSLRDSKNLSLLHHVVVSAYRDGDAKDLLHALVAAGVDVNAVERNMRTPLHFAALCRNVSSLRVLFELGAEVDRQDCLGSTSLHWLAGNGKEDGPIVELLLALGANVRVVDNRGRTACRQAANNRLRTHLCALLAAGGELELSDTDSDADQLPTAVEIEAARQRIARTRLDFVRHRALEICIGLQPLNLDALQLCEIMTQSAGVFGSLIAFHQWWKIATLVKHFCPH